MVIEQGEIYWADFDEGGKRPVLVIQNDVFNQSRISTVIVCAITSNLERAKAPGNVLLKKGEAKLIKTSVANVSHIFTLFKSELIDKIGKLSNDRFAEVINGVKLVIEPLNISW